MNFSVFTAKKDRMAMAERKSAETQISVELNLDGSGQIEIETGFGLLDHMLCLIAFWANFDLRLKCDGDIHVDAHHTAEDCGLTLGKAFHGALGDKLGIARVGCGRVPMDEALAETTVDISGRPWLEWRGDDLLPPVLGGEEKDVWREFYKAFATSGRINLHVSFLYGKNGHHLLESAAKGFGVALSRAIEIRDEKIRSSKGGID